MSTASQPIQPLLCCCLHHRILAPELAVGTFVRRIYAPGQPGGTSATVSDQHQKAGET
jgi:hypothetical protein